MTPSLITKEDSVWILNKIRKLIKSLKKTLVVGIDIAKETHYACFVDDRGRVLQNSFSVSQSGGGFELFYQSILTAMEVNEKTEVIIGIEPTGHYWINLAYFPVERGIPLAMVNPIHVKRSKELDDNLPTKHDRKDALMIARLVKEGRFSYPRSLTGMEAELRVGSTFRSKLTEELGAVKNMIIRWLDRYFPEFVQVFPSFGKMAMAALECTLFPSDLHQKQPDDILILYRKVEGLKSPQRTKPLRLIEVAANSIGITEGRGMARIEIVTLVRRYYQPEQDIESITQQLVELVKTSIEYEWLSTFPGLGGTTIVDLLAEIGSFSHYEDPRQLIKLAGLTLRENSSGLHKGQKRISKRGRRKLRALLFRVMLPMIRHNEAFRKLHEHYTNRKVNPLRKKQSIVVLCGKLLKVLHGISTKHKAFDAQRVMRDIPSLAEAA